MSVFGMTAFTLPVLVKNKDTCLKGESHHFTLSETHSGEWLLSNRLLMLCYYKKLS